MSEQTLEQQMRALLDKQAITEVLHRYCRAIDRYDASLLASVYHEDAMDYHGVYNGPIAGFVEALRGKPGLYVATSHKVSNILIELDGDVARSETYLNAMHRRETADGLVDDFLHCRYLDRFERRNGEWRIAKRTVVYDWGITQPAIARAWWTDLPGDYVFGTKDDNDPLYQAAIFSNT